MKKAKNEKKAVRRSRSSGVGVAPIGGPRNDTARIPADPKPSAESRTGPGQEGEDILAKPSTGGVFQPDVFQKDVFQTGERRVDASTTAAGQTDAPLSASIDREGDDGDALAGTPARLRREVSVALEGNAATVNPEPAAAGAAAGTSSASGGGAAIAATAGNASATATDRPGQEGPDTLDSRAQLGPLPPDHGSRLDRANTSVGKAVLVNLRSLEITGLSLVILLGVRIAELQRQNTDDAHAALADYKDLKTRVEAFLAAASQFAAGKTEEQALVKSKTWFADGFRDIWKKRHLAIADVGLLGVAAGICQMVDPLSAVIAGAVVGGKPVVDAIKAAADVVKKRGHE